MRLLLFALLGVYFLDLYIQVTREPFERVESDIDAFVERLIRNAQ